MEHESSAKATEGGELAAVELRPVTSDVESGLKCSLSAALAIFRAGITVHDVRRYESLIRRQAARVDSLEADVDRLTAALRDAMAALEHSSRVHGCTTAHDALAATRKALEWAIDQSIG